eukprot:1228031-Rhodomonas_salina.1
MKKLEDAEEGNSLENSGRGDGGTAEGRGRGDDGGADQLGDDKEGERPPPFLNDTRKLPPFCATR